MLEARSPVEAVEERGSERRCARGQVHVRVKVAGKELVRAGVVAEAVIVATQNDGQNLAGCRPRTSGWG